MIKNNFRILKKQYAYLQTILKTPVKFQKDWPKTVGGVADTRMVVGADGRTDTQNFGGYNIIPRHFLVAGHKNALIFSPFNKFSCLPHWARLKSFIHFLTNVSVITDFR